MPLVYKLTSPSNKVYIGQSWNWIKRKSVYRRKACPMQPHLQNSLNKYGFENHVIDKIIATRKENGVTCSEETKLKIGNANRGEKNGMFNKIGELSHSSKKVIDLMTNVIFSSTREASNKFNINNQSLINKLNGRTKNNTTLVYLSND